jgi:single-stranded-DNA-specific exonuclease
VPAEWIVPDRLDEDRPRFHDDPLLDAILARRLDDEEAAADFLDDRPRAAPDPHALPGLSEAAQRICWALRRGEPIGIFGDYDTDGVTSAALLTLALRAASGDAQPAAVRLPRRPEGYGLSEAGVEELAAGGIRLLVAVDCGSKDHRAVARARELGMDVVILDHHRIVEPPPAGAVVASAQLQPDAPYRNLSAAGLAYLMATALAGEGFDAGSGAGHEPTALLDLAMIGLIGDVSSLTGVNRPLVRDGLRGFRGETRLGLRALCEVARIDAARAGSTEIAFQVSPRLNAPGRLGDPRPAYDLLVTRNRAEATRLAEQAETANRTRKGRQERILRDIDEILAADPARLERRVLVFAGQGWEAGIVGLAASKLVERYGRPAIVLAVRNGIASGSARSVADFDITGALASAAHLLHRHGGHERAAGLALPVERVAELDEALQDAMVASEAAPPGPAKLHIDADLEPGRLRLDVARLLQQLGPFGEGNPEPLLRIAGAPLRDYTVMGRERQHLKMLTTGTAGLVDAVLWSGAERSRELVGARHVDMVGSLEINTWNGTSRVQVRVADFRVADAKSG